jgi:hypothetical protein
MDAVARTDYLHLRGYAYERLDGSVRGEERHLAVQAFTTDATAFVFLLSTRAGGVGLNLTAADTVIFLDSDMNPQVHTPPRTHGHTHTHADTYAHAHDHTDACTHTRP